MALRKEITAQAIGDLGSINLVVLLLRRRDRAQHKWIRNLDLLRMRKQVIVNSPGEDRGLHGYHSRLGNSLYPRI